MLERPELVIEPPFNTREGRIGNRDALNALISEAFAEENRDYWIEKIRSAGVPGGSVQTVRRQRRAGAVAYDGDCDCTRSVSALGSLGPKKKNAGADVLP